MRFACGCSLDEDGTRLESCSKPNSPWCDQPRAERECELQAWFLNYEQLGRAIGKMLDEKQQRYGDSFHHCDKILRILYPAGITLNQYHHVLYIARMLDKMFRLAQPGADPEDPIADMAGYSLLMTRKVEER